MCGRYASARKRIELLEEFSVESDRVTEPLEPDWNVAPTKQVYAVLTRHPRPGPEVDGAASGGAASAGAASADGAQADPAALAPVRQLRTVRWGLVPSWAKDPSIGSRMINARAETLSVKPAFRRAFARRRCLLPADGYYEWQQPGAAAAASDKPGKAAKQPYYIYRADGASLAFAGLYEFWRDRSLPDGDPAAWLTTATIITTSATDELGQIHDRMPMVIGPDRWADWLDPDRGDVADLLGLLAPAAAAGLATRPVSTEVNSVRHNGPQLIRPVDPEAGQAAGEPPAHPGGKVPPNGPAGPDGQARPDGQAGPSGPAGEPDPASGGQPATLF
jgi:putative SOS response-associated peptidase YedK